MQTILGGFLFIWLSYLTFRVFVISKSIVDLAINMQKMARLTDQEIARAEQRLNDKLDQKLDDPSWNRKFDIGM